MSHFKEWISFQKFSFSLLTFDISFSSYLYQSSLSIISLWISSQSNSFALNTASYLSISLKDFPQSVMSFWRIKIFSSFSSFICFCYSSSKESFSFSATAQSENYFSSMISCSVFESKSQSYSIWEFYSSMIDLSRSCSSSNRSL